MGIWDRSGRLRHSVGIETKGGKFTRLIQKGAPLPVSLTETFTTADPGQSSITIKPCQGERPLAALNKRLGVFEVSEIPTSQPRQIVIEVTFCVDAQGAFSMTAKDRDTGRDLPVLRH
jgi:molecular chaperone DnaK